MRAERAERVFRRIGGWVAVAAVAWAARIPLGAANESEAAPEFLPTAQALLEETDSSLEADEGEPMRVSMEFQNANIKDVLKLFSQQTGINVLAGSDVPDQTVTLYLEDVTVQDALDQILAVTNLTFERPIGSEIYIVKPKTDGVSTITRVYRLRYARVSKSVLAKVAESFGQRTPFEGTLASSSSGSSSGGAGGSLGGSSSSSSTVGIDTVIEALLTEQGDVVVDGRTNSLIITDIPGNFARLEAALSALDVRTQQIMVDAEVIETTLSKLKDLGVDWDSTSEGDLFTLTPGSRSTRFPFGFLKDGYGPTGPSAFTASTLSAANFKGILQALETDTDTKILARPKILTLDNESALIRLTTDEAIGFQSTQQATTGSVTAEPERSTTGVVLVVTPQVNEHGYITMLVEPSVSKTVSSQISPPSGQTKPRDPKTRTSRSMVRIKSGDTLVVGGLIDRSDQETLKNVPVLSGIPFLGEAFKNTEINNSASELIVFITPRLLEETPEHQLAAAPTPLGRREQEPLGARQETIEETLNALEHSSH